MLQSHPVEFTLVDAPLPIVKVSDLFLHLVFPSINHPTKIRVAFIKPTATKEYFVQNLFIIFTAFLLRSVGLNRYAFYSKSFSFRKSFFRVFRVLV